MKMFYCGLRHFVLIMAGLSLSACLSLNKAIHTERYSLPDIAPTVPAANAKQVLVLQAVVLADFLDSDRIVLQIDDISLRPTRDHLWADALSNQLDRALMTRLGKQLPNTIITRNPPGLPANAIQVKIAIDQFQGHMHGYAITSGQWQLTLPNGAGTQSQPFRFETPLSENGYPALVRALGNNVDLLTTQISQAISRQ